METAIDLAPGAEGNALAVRLADLVRGNVAAHPDKASTLRALRAAVLIVSKDTDASLTLRFDHGRLTIHDGAIGVPTMTLCGDEATLLALASVPMTRLGKLPLPRGASSRAVVSSLLGQLLQGELMIYGLFAHPRLLLRLLRILSTHG